MYMTFTSKHGERKMIADFHAEAARKGIRIKRFRLDRVGTQVTIRAVEYVK